MGARGTYIHFRSDDELQADLTAFIEESGAQNTSQAVRALLRTALGSPIKRTAASEALMSLHSVQRLVFGRLNREIQARFQTVVDDVLGGD